MNTPLLLVEDCTSQPSITIGYASGDNELDFRAVYTRIKSLLTHPKCEHIGFKDSWPCSKCEKAFCELYWSCAADILDYFADFYSADTPLMQSMWFHLLGVWQEGGTWLPCEAALDSFNPLLRIHTEKESAGRFLEHVKEAIALLDTVILGAGRTKGTPRDPIIHDPSGEAETPAGYHETGPWISGLKPWQQFLYEASPGVASSPFSIPDEDQSHANHLARHIPMPAISIIHRHTTRARSLASKLAALDPDTAVEFLNTFDQHALKFPTALLHNTQAQPQTQTHTYTSPLTGNLVTYQLTNGAPLISRYVGLGDPSMFVESPTWTLVDECVGVCKGVEAYEPQGTGGGGGAGEGEGEEGEDEDEEVFDMWSVCERTAVEEGEGRELEVVLEGYGEMFEEWCGDEEI